MKREKKPRGYYRKLRMTIKEILHTVSVYPWCSHSENEKRLRLLVKVKKRMFLLPQNFEPFMYVYDSSNEGW